MKILIIAIMILLTSACTDDKFSGLSDSELAAKQNHCDSIRKKSPGFAVGCENIRKEVERRKKAKK